MITSDKHTIRDNHAIPSINIQRLAIESAEAAQGSAADARKTRVRARADELKEKTEAVDAQFRQSMADVATRREGAILGLIGSVAQIGLSLLTAGGATAMSGLFTPCVKVANTVKDVCQVGLACVQGGVAAGQMVVAGNEDAAKSQREGGARNLAGEGHKKRSEDASAELQEEKERAQRRLEAGLRAQEQASEARALLRA